MANPIGNVAQAQQTEQIAQTQANQNAKQTAANKPAATPQDTVTISQAGSTANQAQAALKAPTTSGK
jgi:hypothetical protein